MTKTEELISLILSCRSDEAIERMESKNFNKEVFRDIFAVAYDNPELNIDDLIKDFSAPVSIFSIVRLLEIYFSDDNWTPEYYPTVLVKRDAVRKMKEYFEMYHGMPRNFDIDFDIQREESARLNTDFFDIEDTFDGTIEQLMQKGYGREEIEMAWAILTLDFPTFRKHLKSGTDCDIYISGLNTKDEAQGEEAVEGINPIEEAKLSQEDMFTCWDFGDFWQDKKGDSIREWDYHQIFGLFQGAAYTKLLMEIYATERSS